MKEGGNLVCKILRELNVTMGKAARKTSFKILPGSCQDLDTYPTALRKWLVLFLPVI